MLKQFLACFLGAATGTATVLAIHRRPESKRMEIAMAACREFMAHSSSPSNGGCTPRELESLLVKFYSAQPNEAWASRNVFATAYPYMMPLTCE
jgi:hypothetical protein